MSAHVEICHLTNGTFAVSVEEKSFAMILNVGTGLRAERHFINLTTRESVAKLREQCDLWLATQ